MKNNIYKITVLNWYEHNPNAKKHFKKTLISNSILSEGKLMVLPTSDRWLFVVLLILCGDMSKDCVTLSERQLKLYLTSGVSPLKVLQRLEQVQLLRVEKIDSLIIEENRRERIEEKRIEVKRSKTGSKKEVDQNARSLNSEIWTAYFDAYRLRYGVDPVRNAKTNSIISQLAARLGLEAIEVVKFYLTHNDSFYLKNLHAIGHCLTNAESLRTQMLRGKTITSKNVQDFEKTMGLVELMKDSEKGGF